MIMVKRANPEQCLTYICVDIVSNYRRPIGRLSLAVGWTEDPEKQIGYKFAATDKGHFTSYLAKL